MEKNMRAYSKDDAQYAMRIATLPETYEKVLNSDGGDVTKARAAMLTDAPTNVRENINVIQVENTTSIIAYDPQSHSVSISFDPTLTFGDKWDNFRRGHENHTLGGEVHGGLYSDLLKDPENDSFPGENMMDVVEAMLHNYASKNDQPLSVNFSGFSKGGSQTAIAAGELIGRGFFEDNPNIQLDNIYTFAAPGYGDEEFLSKFNEETSKLGTNVWSSELHGDPVPTVLTKNGSNYFTKYDYGQVGGHAYITPSNDGLTTELYLNPDEKTLDKLRDQPKTDEKMHTTQSYETALEKISAGEAAPIDYNISTPDIAPILKR